MPSGSLAAVREFGSSRAPGSALAITQVWYGQHLCARYHHRSSVRPPPQSAAPSRIQRLMIGCLPPRLIRFARTTMEILSDVGRETGYPEESPPLMDFGVCCRDYPSASLIFAFQHCFARGFHLCSSRPIHTARHTQLRRSIRRPSVPRRLRPSHPPHETDQQFASPACPLARARAQPVRGAPARTGSHIR